MTKWDKILIVSIIIISLFFIGVITYIKNQAHMIYGIIEVNSVEQDVINLTQIDQPYTIKVENGDNYNIVEISHNSIRFVEATCPDKDCIRIGKLNAPGEISVCLPNKVIIRVEGEGFEHEDDLDSTTY